MEGRLRNLRIWVNRKDVAFHISCAFNGYMAKWTLHSQALMYSLDMSLKLTLSCQCGMAQPTILVFHSVNLQKGINEVSTTLIKRQHKYSKVNFEQTPIRRIGLYNQTAWPTEKDLFFALMS
ncbi:hypothetical protein DPMN_037828 [Dreissena polymorpha]|uniref:Uncharacterized protein n=1 Tax=Dreissena polymorpha TaxID=45954 RepID=A0A9D4ME44_DREPO|nr:hypothetical protein DPMN_037828 [Dreissena polymorpha]